MSARPSPYEERLRWWDAVRSARSEHRSTALPQTRLKDATTRQLKAEVRARKRKP